MSEKEIRVCIAKIFNWQQQHKVCHLLIEFFSKQNSNLIAKKAVKATLINNFLEIGILLKIKYSSNQNELIAVIQRTNSQGHFYSMVGEVQINLDEILKKKIKYFPLGDMDKVLQVQVSEVGTQNSEKVSMQEINKKRNQQFLQQRRKFLENVNHTQKLLKRNFSQKIMSLLNDKNSERDSQISRLQSNQPITRMKEYEKNSGDLQSFESRDNNSCQILNKCTSQYGMNFNRKNIRVYERQPQEFQANSTINQNHKLVLNSLNIVPPPLPKKFE